MKLMHYYNPIDMPMPIENADHALSIGLNCGERI